MTSFITAVQNKESNFNLGNSRLRLVSGTTNPKLAEEIASYLGIENVPLISKRFADGELYVQIQQSIRGCDVFLIQPTCAPVNDSLMELMIMVDACKRASARQVTAVIPYYGYARADRKTAGRESITAKLSANLLVASGVDRVLAMDLHSAQIQGYFDIPCDHIYGSPVLIDYLSTKELEEIVVVSPDVGGVARARAFAKQMNDAPLAIIDKRREQAGISEVMHIIGDVSGADCIVVDDIVDSAGTLCNAAGALIDAGAKSVSAYITHGVLSGGAVSRVSSSPLENMVTTDSIMGTEAVRVSQNVRQLSIAPLIGEAISRISDEKSVSSLFD